MTNRQPKNNLYLCGRKVKTNAIKGTPVDQSSGNSFSGLIHVVEFGKTLPYFQISGERNCSKAPGVVVKKCSQISIQLSFGKTNEVKRGKSGKQLINLDTYQNDVSQLNISSHAVKKGFF